MTDISVIKAANAARWKICNILPNRVNTVNIVAGRLIAPNAKVRYQEIEKATKVPWFIVAVIHEREADQNWNCQLGQGDPLNQVSRHVPKGRGPFLNHPTDPPLQDAFYRGAVDALNNCPPYAGKWTDWTAGGALTILELYNGVGYETYHHECSPYIWGATNQEERGKYVGDGKYDPSVLDSQIGCAAMLKAMMVLDTSIKLTDEA
jgi:lysozyme family protein